MLKNNKGLTLIEILVAMTLMFTAVFCFTPLMLSSIDALVLASDGREEMYSEKASLEENLADGVTIKDENSFDGFTVTFNQDSNTQHSSVKGQYINSDNNKLNTFIGRDNSSLKISPSAIPPQVPYYTEIVITSDNIYIDDVMQFQLLEDGVKNSDVIDYNLATFTTDPIVNLDTFATEPDNNPYKSYMYILHGNKFDPEKEYHVTYGNMKAELEILPYSIIAVGEGGRWAYYIGDGEWGGSNEKLSGVSSNTDGPALRDVVWTGSQFVTAGDNGSFWYTDEDAQWVKKSPGNTTFTNKTYFTALEVNGDDVYITGHVLNGGDPSSDVSNRITEQVLSKPEDLTNQLGIQWTYGTAISTVKLGKDIRKLWANYSYSYQTKTSTIAIGLPGYMVNESTNEEEDSRQQDNGDYVQFRPEDVIADIKHNGYTNSKSEIVAVCENGKIFINKNGGLGNADASSDPTKNWVLNSDAGFGTSSSYTSYSKTTNSYSVRYQEERPFEYVTTKVINPGYNYTTFKYYVDIDESSGTDYKYTYGLYPRAQIVQKSTKQYSDAVVIDTSAGATNGKGLRTVEYGEPDGTISSGIWVAGGDVSYQKGKAYLCDMTRTVYSAKSGGWTQYSFMGNSSVKYNRYHYVGGTTTSSTQRAVILWRDANETDAGNWHPAIVHTRFCEKGTSYTCSCVDVCICGCTCSTRCGAINDIIFLNGKFYAVADVEVGGAYDDTILESDDGKHWYASHQKTYDTVGCNFYAIAGYEWQN